MTTLVLTSANANRLLTKAKMIRLDEIDYIISTQTKWSMSQNVKIFY